MGDMVQLRAADQEPRLLCSHQHQRFGGVTMQRIIDRTLILAALVLSCVAVVRGGELQGTYEPTGIYAPQPMKVAAPIELSVRKPPMTAKVNGLHSHTCPRCGHSWSHGSSSFGNAAAHQCAKCGKMVWEQDGTVRTAAPVVRIQSSCPSGGCPNGHCPASNAGRRR